MLSKTQGRHYLASSHRDVHTVYIGHETDDQEEGQHHLSDTREGRDRHRGSKKRGELSSKGSNSWLCRRSSARRGHSLHPPVFPRSRLHPGLFPPTDRTEPRPKDRGRAGSPEGFSPHPARVVSSGGPGPGPFARLSQSETVRSGPAHPAALTPASGRQTINHRRTPGGTASRSEWALELPFVP